MLRSVIIKRKQNLVTSNMPNQDVKKQDAYHMMKYLNLLKFQLIGFTMIVSQRKKEVKKNDQYLIYIKD